MKRLYSPLALSVALLSITATGASAQIGAIDSWSFFAPSTVANPEIYQFELHPFSRLLFDSRQDFEDWLNDLGGRGLGSVFHFPNNLQNARDDQRLFMHSSGGDFVRVFEYEIEQYTVDPGVDPAEVWVEAWDDAGAEGGILVFLFQEGNRWYAVWEKTRIDGELLTWSWALRRAGGDEFPTSAEYKRAATYLAKRGYLPQTIGFSADRSKYYVVGIAETTAGDPEKIKLKFKKSGISTSAEKFARTVNKMGRKGFRLADLQMFGGDPENQLMVFARILENGVKTKRTECLLELITVNDPEAMLDPLNQLGAEGRRVDFVANVESFFTTYVILCDPNQSTPRF